MTIINICVHYFNDILGQCKQDIRKTWCMVNTLIGRTNDKNHVMSNFIIIVNQNSMYYIIRNK